VILARSFMARFVSCLHQHAGNQARQDIEPSTARATAVAKAGQHEQNTAAADTADDGEHTAGWRSADDRHRIGKISAMGS